MFDTDFIVRYLHFAAENAESLQRNLSYRQDDVLALEEAVLHLSAGSATGQLVVDRAEDLRRVVSVHAEDDLPIVRSGLNYANSAITEAVGDGALTPEVRRTLARMVEVAATEGRRAADGLDDTVNALSSTSHASPNDPRLVSVAQRSVEESTSLLERTRRAVFRIVEDLPDITNAVLDTIGTAHGARLTDRRRLWNSRGARRTPRLAAGPGDTSHEPQPGRRPRCSRPLTSLDETQP